MSGSRGRVSSERKGADTDGFLIWDPNDDTVVSKLWDSDRKLRDRDVVDEPHGYSQREGVPNTEAEILLYCSCGVLVPDPDPDLDSDSVCGRAAEGAESLSSMSPAVLFLEASPIQGFVQSSVSLM